MNLRLSFILVHKILLLKKLNFKHLHLTKNKAKIISNKDAKITVAGQI